MPSIFSEEFKRLERIDEQRQKAMIVSQIRNAIIQIQEGDTDEAIAILLALIGESPVGDEPQP